MKIQMWKKYVPKCNIKEGPVADDRDADAEKKGYRIAEPELERWRTTRQLDKDTTSYYWYHTPLLLSLQARRSLSESNNGSFLSGERGRVGYRPNIGNRKK